ncbi:DNA-binding transcriptional regulator, ArsR family [Gracilibacillus orientalis]|uniref:DNA-binding transcriptional regulator, ArsR family n=1 Tax=Gracilibacillus orientalis TaxID=334253 RepID=A0A1I4J662_9BACI|nr:autorepressor SdpR family transcription factor [Gracilibacillus orientalis]SFL62078.1 DNA-binding transcriptional regulator, ArsR family [Gracilibacillus orientalis]
MNKTFKALSDNTRLKILELLKDNDMTAGEIAGHFDMTKPSISHHLNLLKEAELIFSRRKGQHIFYSLNSTVFQDLFKWIVSFQKKEDH